MENSVNGITWTVTMVMYTKYGYGLLWYLHTGKHWITFVLGLLSVRKIYSFEIWIPSIKKVWNANSRRNILNMYGVTTSWVEKVKKMWSVFLLIGHGRYNNNGKITWKLRQITDMYNIGNDEGGDWPVRIFMVLFGFVTFHSFLCWFQYLANSWDSDNMESEKIWISSRFVPRREKKIS